MIRLLLLKEDTYRTCYIPRPTMGNIWQHTLYSIIYAPKFVININIFSCVNRKSRRAVLNTRSNRRIHIHRSEHD